jgi:anti-sigma regulatory factor (Ser/Thr protein kinase)
VAGNLRILVRCDSYAPKVVREALEALPEAEPAKDEALLVASELVTNAVRHSECAQEEQLTVSACRAGNRLRISVMDPGHSGRPAQVVDRPPDSGGMGLKVVEELSERWGAERHPGGYEVWAEVPLAA